MCATAVVSIPNLLVCDGQMNRQTDRHQATAYTMLAQHHTVKTDTADLLFCSLDKLRQSRQL